ncbi:TPA: hypothetical protein L4I47_000777 [Pseudomonas aeruginosa]|uniref:hypothetical protein n=1 Tax=Pseudomonas aeruginosa TaxID=287 RepID=UPI000A407244|nr:hypothetical protein [Pseudomonas aeruginosa]EKX0428607.1 hypothetical protein [Pseudomonas aeruginosa]ELZ3635346.1 hypothetical protein [Pseudomonas aeruginosa]EMB2823910.1 hypothetical protein [Pseudomonas aeruginosa]MCS7517209.1 hypothetical protein [Pseudomonas aeruginosa]MCS9783840.1 hypothetical protein [Pseudomonas aeruginosa]
MTDTNKLKELAAQYLANPSGTAGEDSEFRAAANPQAILEIDAARCGNSDGPAS